MPRDRHAPRAVRFAAWACGAAGAAFAASAPAGETHAPAAPAVRPPVVAPRPSHRAVRIRRPVGQPVGAIQLIDGEGGKPRADAAPITRSGPIAPPLAAAWRDGRSPGGAAPAPADDSPRPFRVAGPVRAVAPPGGAVRVDDGALDNLPGLRGVAGRLVGGGTAAVTPGAVILADPARPTPPVLEEEPAEPTIEVSRPAVAPLDPLAATVDEAIALSAARLLTGEDGRGRTNTPWQLGHGLMALRGDYAVLVNGRPTNAAEWLATGPSYKGEGWFVRGTHGPKAHDYSGVMYDFQGHPNQILAFVAMGAPPLDTVFRDERGRAFTLADWINTAQREVRLNRNEEVTWTLWAFSLLLDPDAEWVNARGERWSTERLVQEEVKSVVTEHACGGTHGLFALASARNAYLQSGRRLRGPWLMGHEKVSRYVEFTRRLQNPDGSLSHNYYKGREHTRDLVARTGSSGHTLEFLMMALPQKELDAPWVRSAVGRVARDLLDGRNEPVGGKAVGGLYHAVHALVLYRERTAPDAPQPVPLRTGADLRTAAPRRPGAAPRTASGPSRRAYR